jgi:hypothetical protein
MNNGTEYNNRLDAERTHSDFIGEPDYGKSDANSIQRVPLIEPFQRIQEKWCDPEIPSSGMNTSLSFCNSFCKETWLSQHAINAFRIDDSSR